MDCYYKVVCGNKLPDIEAAVDSLMKEVNEHMQRGWKISGGVLTTIVKCPCSSFRGSGTVDNFIVMQAMTRPSNEECAQIILKRENTNLVKLKDGKIEEYLLVLPTDTEEDIIKTIEEELKRSGYRVWRGYQRDRIKISLR